MDLNDICSSDYEDLLFHYTTASTALAYILPSGNIKFNALSETNDPIENQELLHIAIAPPMEGHLALAFKTREHQKEQMKPKLACFCCSPKNISTPFQAGGSRARMWAQYGDNHKGICLVFSKKKLINAVDNWASTRGIKIETHCNNVAYQETLQKLQATCEIREEEEPAARIARFLSQYYFFKLKDYTDESEFRYVLYHPSFTKENVLYLDYKDSLQGIILGSAYPRDHNDIALNIAKDLQIDCVQANWTPTSIYFDTPEYAYLKNRGDKAHS